MVSVITLGGKPALQDKNRKGAWFPLGIPLYLLNFVLAHVMLIKNQEYTF